MCFVGNIIYATDGYAPNSFDCSCGKFAHPWRTTATDNALLSIFEFYTKTNVYLDYLHFIVHVETDDKSLVKIRRIYFVYRWIEKPHNNVQNIYSHIYTYTR